MFVNIKNVVVVILSTNTFFLIDFCRPLTLCIQLRDED